MISNKDTFNINIRQFDMKKIQKDSSIVLLGKRRTGKSFLVKDILYNHKDIPLGMVISRTEHLNAFYSDFIPNMFIYSKYEPQMLDKLFARQERAINENWQDPCVFLLFDDCLSDASNWKKDERIKEIFFNGRHYKILYLLTMQAPMGIPPEMRTNIDFTFILKNNNANDREKIYKNYAGVFPTREIFECVMDECTENYHCLVIDNTTHSKHLEDQVFIYKAKNHEDFKMCPKSLWKISEERYKNNSYNKNLYEKKEFLTKSKKKIVINKKIKK